MRLRGPGPVRPPPEPTRPVEVRAERPVPVRVGIVAFESFGPGARETEHPLESAELLLEELERDPDLGRKPKLVVALGIEKDAARLLKA